MTTSDNVVIETEISQELRPEYVEVLKALIKANQLGFFPLKAGGNIMLHYDDNGKLVKIVTSLVVKT